MYDVVYLQIEIIGYCSATCLFSIIINDGHCARSVFQIQLHSF